jgi:hypothetical protein
VPSTAKEVWKPLVEQIRERAPEYSLYWAYWMGNNNLPVDTAEFKSRFGKLFEDFRDNLARPIIQSAESRIRVNDIGDGKGSARLAKGLWDRNNMDFQSQLVHTEALVKGDGFVIVLPRKDGTPGIWPQVSESCAILYDDLDPQEKVAAMKWWVLKGDAPGKEKVRVNLYFEDRIERYISKTIGSTLEDDFGKYERFTDKDNDIAWKTPHKVGEVPMFEFNANYDLASGRGRSDLADAAPIIDAINKTFLDMMTASEFTAAPQRWATGVEIPIDPKTGKPAEAYKSGSDRLWTAPNEEAKFGQFAPGSLNAYKDAIELLKDDLAFNTATPSYALLKQSQYPSGEALRSAEAPLRGRVTNHQDAFGPVWQRVLMAALKLDEVKLPDGVESNLLPDWLPANAPFATKELLEELKVKAEVLGVPEEMLWREAGYSSAEIEEMKSMREEEAELGLDPFAGQVAAIVGGAPSAEEAGGVINDGTTPPQPTAPATPASP